MNAIFKPAQPLSALEAQFQAMTPAWLDSVVRVEQCAYAHPWTIGNFTDSLQSGYEAQMLVAGGSLEQNVAEVAIAAELLGYFVAMKGVDEVHLLNFTVAPAHQRQGWARVMLDALAIWARGHGAQWLWLEVRVSNARAKAIYEHYGFREVGVRRDYYPEGGNAAGQPPKREDASVMSFAL
jgi:ribosomal-protein-alanine N-acetyltransferase